ncbi:MAG: hypothetical protein Kow00121_16380 [Elainellaceae cyanobacterium]
MRINFNQLKNAIRYKNSGNLGDFAVLKADALGAKVHPTLAAQLKPLEGYHPPIDLQQLSHYSDGSFGREYARYMQENHLTPFNVSPELDEIAKRNVFALRYAVTHDIFHVLLGFDTSYAGEIGVLAFAAEQGYSRSLRLSLWLASLLYPLLAPGQIRAILNNRRQGRKLGKQAECLLKYRFEDHWHEPIDHVKKTLRLSTT